MSELLLELLSEEMPSLIQQKSADSLKDLLEIKFKENEISYGLIQAFSAPRRITIYIKDFKFKTEQGLEEKRGPKISASDISISGFAKSLNIDLDKLIVKDGYYFANITKEPKGSDKDFIKIINHSIKELKWPKSMKWGNNDIRWIRPLNNILCIYNKKILPVSFGHLTANNYTVGHRFLGNKIEISLENPFTDYTKKLFENYVILNREDRKNLILAQANNIALENGLSLKEDNDLLDEVSGLIDYPFVFLIKIDKEFMSLPEDVLICSIRKNQKYLMLENYDKTLAPYCLVVSNIKTSDENSCIIAGNERVLRARLFDARFFYQQDIKNGLEKMQAKLKNISFHAKIGSIADKVNQMNEFVKNLPVDQGLISQAIKLCKADLVSDMVNEFPELQGIMGYYYAKSSGKNIEIAKAIRDHYKPISKNDEPASGLAAFVAISDKLTTIVSMFAINEKPTSSKDPFALRRAAIGIIRIVIANNIDISLKEMVSSIIVKNNYESSIHEEVLNFFTERFRNFLREENISNGIILSVLNGHNIDNILDIYNKINILEKYLTSSQGLILVGLYKRVYNIINAEEQKDKIIYHADILLSPNFTLDAEKKLYIKIKEIEDKLVILIKDKKYQDSLICLSQLSTFIENFFDKVMVNVEDHNVRKNRLLLLSSVIRLIQKVANLSLLEG